MRIAQVCPYAWDSPGGVQAHVRGLSGELVRRGHAVHILAPSGGVSEDPAVTLVGGALRVAYNRSVAPVCPNPISLLRIRAALRRFAPDVVHVHEPFAPSSSLWATLVSDVPVVATFHASSETFRLYRAGASLFRAVGRRCAALLAVSDAAAGLVARDLRLSADVVPNGIDIATFTEARPLAVPDDGPTVLFVGRLEPRKGLAVLAHAFVELVARIPTARLLVVGDGPERAVAERLPAAVRARVRMLGALSDDQLPQCYAAADVFVGPATGQESFGIVLLEAMAAGLPIVASDLPGYRGVVRHGVEAVLVPPGDARALAEAVARVLTHADLASSLATNGRSRAETFSWEHLAGRIEAIYDDVRDRRVFAGTFRSTTRAGSSPAPHAWRVEELVPTGPRPITRSAKSARKRAAT